MTYGKAKDLANRNQSDKVSRDKAFKTASDPKYDGYQRGLASLVYKFFDKNLASLNKFSGTGIVMNQIINCKMKFTNQLLKNFKNEKFIHLLETIFGVLI